VAYRVTYIDLNLLDCSLTVTTEEVDCEIVEKQVTEFNFDNCSSSSEWEGLDDDCCPEEIPGTGTSTVHDNDEFAVKYSVLNLDTCEITEDGCSWIVETSSVRHPGSDDLSNH
jgi:hypothetical protein